MQMKLLDIGIAYSDLSSLILTIGGLIAIIGAVVIYRKWSMGNHQIENDLLLWGGGTVMLITLQVFIKVMFGM
jgi:hypothetical protein